MIKPSDRKNFAEYINRQFDEELPYDMARQNIDDNDLRIRKPATLDVVAAAREFDSFSRTETYKNAILATELLDSNVSVSENQLVNALKSKYNFSNAQCHDVLKQLSNSRAVDISRNSYTKEVRLRKKS